MNELIDTETKLDILFATDRLSTGIYKWRTGILLHWKERQISASILHYIVYIA